VPGIGTSLNWLGEWAEWGKLEHMFLGRFEHTLDDKGRLTIPAKYRNTLATGVVITRGLDGCLWVFASSEWDAIAGKIRTLSLLKKDARSFVRLFFSEATDAVPDKQGRVHVPSYLREYANLQDEVIVAGSYNRLELWNPEGYVEENSRLQKDAEALAEQLSELGVL
jgi:MraZ protein